jgi:hypothetical protein
VLLDDHVASIVAGIEQGRATYVNLRRFLTYHLTDNVAELTPFLVWMLSGGRFPLAIGVLQILAIDIGTDTLSAVALGAEPPSDHLIDGPPVGGRLMNATVVRRAFGWLGPTVSAMSMLAFVVSLLDAGWGVGKPWPDAHGIARQRCRVPHHRARAEGQRLGLPQLHPAARPAGVDHQPHAAVDRGDRARVRDGRRVHRTDRESPRAGQSAAVGLGRGGGVDAGGAGRRRPRQALACAELDNPLVWHYEIGDHP